MSKNKCSDCYGNIRIAQHAWKHMLDVAFEALGMENECQRDVFVLTVAYLGLEALMQEGCKEGSDVIIKHMGDAFSFFTKRGIKMLAECDDMYDEIYGASRLWSN